MPLPVNGGERGGSRDRLRIVVVDAERAGDLGEGQRRFIAPSRAVAERRIVRVRRRRHRALVDPRVEHVDEAVHHLRDVDVLQVAALHAVGHRLAAGVAGAAHLVHPVVRRCPCRAGCARCCACSRDSWTTSSPGCCGGQMLLYIWCATSICGTNAALSAAVVSSTSLPSFITTGYQVPAAGSSSSRPSKNRLPSRPTFSPGV